MKSWGGWKGWGLLLALSGCASSFRGPESGGARWVEGRSQHFRLLTTQSEGAVRRSLQDLEVSYAALEQVAFPSTDNPRGTTEIVMLPELEFAELAAVLPITARINGFFSESRQYRDTPPRLVVREGLEEAAHSTLQHELTHRFVAFHFPSAPPWINEGLASFWESMKVEGDILSFGGPVQGFAEPTPLADLLPLRDADFYQGSDLDVHANYVAAEAFTYVLYFQHRDILQAYLNGLKSGMKAQQAWEVAVGPAAAELANDYALFFRERGTRASLPAPRVKAEVHATELSPSDVHVSWANLFHNAHDLQQAQREADLAVQLDDQSAEALVVRARIALASNRGDAAHADLERALALSPSRSISLAAALHYRLQTGQELSMPKKLLAARLLRFKLNPSQQALLARYFESEDKYDRAIQFVSAAVRADSSCFYCYEVGAEIFAAKGDFERARVTLRVALSLAGERATPRDWRRLEELEFEGERERRARK